MIKLKLPEIGIVTYHKDDPPPFIFFEDLSGNKDYNSLVFQDGEYDFEYERLELTKQFKLKEIENG